MRIIFIAFFNPFSCPSSIFTQSTGDDEKYGFAANDHGDENLSNHPFNRSMQHQGKDNLAFGLLPTCHNGDDNCDMVMVRLENLTKDRLSFGVVHTSDH